MAFMNNDTCNVDCNHLGMSYIWWR